MPESSNPRIGKSLRLAPKSVGESSRLVGSQPVFGSLEFGNLEFGNLEFGGTAPVAPCILRCIDHNSAAVGSNSSC